MAITIHPNSPIQVTTGTHFLNIDKPITELFLYDNINSTLDYSIVRKEGTKYKVVFSGLSTGFYDITYGYLFRFDFNPFIRMNKVNTDIIHVNDYYAYMLGVNDCDLTLCIGNIFATSAAMLDVKVNGEIYLKPAYTPSNLIATKYRYTFSDRVDSYGYYKPLEVVGNTWYPITLYSGQINFTIIDVNNEILYGNGFTVPAGYTYKIGFLKLPQNFRSVQFAYNAVGLPELYKSNICADPIYYMDKYGTFDVLYCTGVSNIRDNVTKENIVIGKNVVVTKQTNQKQIVQNTGLNVSETQIRNLLTSQLVYKVESNSLVEYLLDNNSFDGYNGVDFGNKNIELTLTLPYERKRITNKTITFLD